NCRETVKAIPDQVWRKNESSQRQRRQRLRAEEVPTCRLRPECRNCGAGKKIQHGVLGQESKTQRDPANDGPPPNMVFTAAEKGIKGGSPEEKEGHIGRDQSARIRDSRQRQISNCGDCGEATVHLAMRNAENEECSGCM